MADTDGGGESDGSEALNGRNPLLGTDDLTAIQVYRISPEAGITAGGERIQVQGIHFLAGATVDFGGTPGTAVQVMDGQSLLVTTPTHGAGVVDVHVVNPGGATGTLAGGFTYQAAPGLTTALPAAVPTHGGTTVTVTGSGFSEPMRVLFGAKEGSSVTIGSGANLTAISPMMAAGTHNVTVLNQGYQQATLTNVLTAIDIPPAEVTRLDVTKAAGGIGLTWQAVTQATDGYTIRPTQYSIYRNSTLPLPKDPAHLRGTVEGDVTGWLDETAGATAFYLITASYQSAEGQ